MLRFSIIPKQPKDKVAVINEKTGFIFGYLEFVIGKNEYEFKPAFEKTFCAKALREISEKANELNNQ